MRALPVMRAATSAMLFRTLAHTRLLEPSSRLLASNIRVGHATSALPAKAFARVGHIHANAMQGSDALHGVKIVPLPEERYVGGRPFPLTLSPDSSVEGMELTSWGKANSRLLVQLMCSHGAVLLRGWKAGATAENFSEFVRGLGLETFGMGCSAAPRTNVAPAVFTANEAPPSELIPFHHEMAQCDERPAFIMFFCEKEAAAGGATPIIPSDEVAMYLRARHPAVAAKLAEHGVRYVRVMPSENDLSSPIGKSWRVAFEASNEAEAEAAMKRDGTSWEWLAGGDLRTVSKPMPALVTEPRRGKEVFFNSVIAAMQGWKDSRNDPKKAIILGDGSPLTADEIAALEDVAEMMHRSRIAFKWQQGDILLLDNAAVMHSRETFTPPRRVLASLWGPPDDRRGRSARASSGGNGNTHPNGGASVPMLRLKSHDRLPAVGFGLWKTPRDVCADAVVAAISAGYRHLDCACDYGNEAQVGEGIRRAIDEGLVRREELWVTSKLWNTYHSAEHVEMACRKSLSDLQLDYVDLYLVHFPFATRYVPFEARYPPEWIYDPDAPVPQLELVPVPLHETWRAMEALVGKGLARNIGMCNVGCQTLRDMMTYAAIPPAVLQVELHVYNQQPNLLRFCRENGIVVTGFSPLGAPSYFELGMATQSESALDNAVIKRIADKHGKTPAQVLLAWGVQRGCAVIPKSTVEARIRENLNVCSFTLDEADLKDIATLDQGRRFNDPAEFAQGMGPLGTFLPIYD